MDFSGFSRSVVWVLLLLHGTSALDCKMGATIKSQGKRISHEDTVVTCEENMRCGRLSLTGFVGEDRVTASAFLCMDEDECSRQHCSLTNISNINSIRSLDVAACEVTCCLVDMCNAHIKGNRKENRRRGRNRKNDNHKKLHCHEGSMEIDHNGKMVRHEMSKVRCNHPAHGPMKFQSSCMVTDIVTEEPNSKPLRSIVSQCSNTTLCESMTCATVRDFMEADGTVMKSCDIICCKEDLCNVRGAAQRISFQTLSIIVATWCSILRLGTL